MIKRLSIIILAFHFCLFGLFGQDATHSISDSPWLDTLAVGDIVNILQASIRSSIGRQAPTLEFNTISDRSRHTLSEFAGNVVMVNFWSRSCKPCIQEMPDISQLQSDYEHAGFIVLFLTDNEYETQNRFFAIHKTNGLKGWVDNRTLLKPYQVEVIPMSLLIDRKAVIRDGWFGAIGYDSMEARINTLLPKEQKSVFASVSRLINQLPMPSFYVYCAGGGVLLIITGLSTHLLKRKSRKVITS